MTNPYTKFIDLADKWHKKGNVGLGSSRLGHASESVWAFSDMRKAFELLFRIEDDLRTRAEYESLLRSLWRFVLSPRTDWASNNRSPLNESDRLILLTRGDVWVHTNQHSERGLTSAQIDSFKADLEEARDLVNGFAHVVGAEAAVVLRIIGDLLAALSEDEPDFDRVHRLANEYGGAIIPVAVAADSETRERLLSSAFRATSQWFSNASSASAGAIAANPAVVQAITGLGGGA